MERWKTGLKKGGRNRVTSERERWTNLICPECGKWMRLFGAPKNQEVKCMDNCHNTLYLVEWFKTVSYSVAEDEI